MSLIPARRPVDTSWPVSLAFGVPGPYIAKVHTGIDYACPVGTPVYAPRWGVVTISDYSPSDYGNYIEVKSHFGGKVYLVAHLSERLVVPGQRVKRGQIIGYSGKTGNVTGPHVHAEQRHSPFGYWDFEQPTWN